MVMFFPQCCLINVSQNNHNSSVALWSMMRIICCVLWILAIISWLRWILILDRIKNSKILSDHLLHWVNAPPTASLHDTVESTVKCDWDWDHEIYHIPVSRERVDSFCAMGISNILKYDFGCNEVMRSYSLIGSLTIYQRSIMGKISFSSGRDFLIILITHGLQLIRVQGYCKRLSINTMSCIVIEYDIQMSLPDIKIDFFWSSNNSTNEYHVTWLVFFHFCPSVQIVYGVVVGNWSIKVWDMRDSYRLIIREIMIK